MNAFVGEAIFVEADRTSLKVGTRGLKGLLAYLGPNPNPALLQELDRQDADFELRQFALPPSQSRATAASPVRSTEVRS